MASFEEQLMELETIVGKLERGDMTLEDNVRLFERGVVLSNECKKQLSAAESRVQVLMEPERGGDVRVEDLAVAVADGDVEDGLDDGEAE